MRPEAVPGLSLVSVRLSDQRLSMVCPWSQ